MWWMLWHKSEIIWFSLQILSNWGVKWLPCPSRINQKLISAFCTAIYSRNKVLLKPSKANLICTPPIWADFKSPVSWNVVEPSSIIGFAFGDHWWKCPSRCTNGFNCSNSLTIPWPQNWYSAIILCPCDYFCSCCEAHCKADSIKVIDIFR